MKQTLTKQTIDLKDYKTKLQHVQNDLIQVNVTHYKPLAGKAHLKCYMRKYNLSKRSTCLSLVFPLFMGFRTDYCLMQQKSVAESSTIPLCYIKQPLV